MNGEEARMEKYLVETALMGHGLPGVTDKELCHKKELAQGPFVWLQNGKIMLGALDAFLPLRGAGNTIARVSRENLEQAKKQGLTAFLTASATMAVCAELGMPLAITAGMGGIGPAPLAKVGADLLALAELPVALLATAPKDVFDLKATIEWLQSAGVAVFGYGSPVCDGFLIQSSPVSLDGRYEGENGKQMLLLNAVPAGQRRILPAQLAQAMEYGARQAKLGAEYHPAVNAALDGMSGGESSHLQINALCANIALAEIMTFGPEEEGKQ